MKTVTPELAALLNGSTQFLMADLLTIRTASGTVLRYTNADVDVVVGASTFSARGPLIRRSRVRAALGLQVDTLELTINAGPGHLLDGSPLTAAAVSGALDGASVLLERAFLADWAQPAVGTLVLFSGQVSDVSGTRTETQLTVKSALELLNIKMPRNIYQPSCLNTLYDTSCGASRDAVTVAGSLTGTANTVRQVQSGRTEAVGWFDQGVIEFTGGANAGVRRTVKSYAAGQFSFALPLPAQPQAGDAFRAWPGCDKTRATCQAKFSNAARFRGFPFIPVAEIAT